MYKTKYIFIVAVAVFSLMLWGSRTYDAQGQSAEGAAIGGFAADAPFTFEARELIGYRVYSPDYYLGNLGQITDLLIDRCDGRVAFLVVSDTPGFSSELLAVPFGALRRTGEHTFQVVFRGREQPMDNYPEVYDSQWGDRYAQFLAMNRSVVGMKTIPATIDPEWAGNVYHFYGLTPYWSEGTNSHPDIVSYEMSGRTEDLAIHFPDGGLVAFNSGGGLMASYGVAPYWTTCGTCGAEAMNFADVASPPMPSDAKPGECYARVFVAPRCETVSEQVLVRAASERVEQIPAKYETVDETVMVKPASKKIEEVPAEYKTVDEQVLVEPAHTEWKEGRGAVEKMDLATGKIMCLVEIPAKYKTVQKQVLVKPASTREIEIPAQYETRQVQKMIEPAHENHIEIPAEYKTVEKTEKVADGYFEWRKVEGCQAK
ncbi:MAG: PRC-barrel domain-containing protein [Thermodesulfobacteriota bacterium]